VVSEFEIAHETLRSRKDAEAGPGDKTMSAIAQKPTRHVLLPDTTALRLPYQPPRNGRFEPFDLDGGLPGCRGRLAVTVPGNRNFGCAQSLITRIASAVENVALQAGDSTGNCNCRPLPTRMR